MHPLSYCKKSIIWYSAKTLYLNSPEDGIASIFPLVSIRRRKRCQGRIISPNKTKYGFRVLLLVLHLTSLVEKGLGVSLLVGVEEEEGLVGNCKKNCVREGILVVRDR